LFSQNGKQITKKYIALAKKLDVGYEKEKFETWIKSNTQLAIDLLKKNILEKRGEGENRTYYVNFDPQLKVIIREAKFLDRIGKEIP
jgi:dynein heavy chain